MATQRWIGSAPLAPGRAGIGGQLHAAYRGRPVNGSGGRLIRDLGMFAGTRTRLATGPRPSGLHGSIDTISSTNVDQIIAEYLGSIENLGDSIENLRGRRLLEALKREVVGSGPYPHVTLFEAANRIMTDLVILYGVKWLLNHKAFPFDTYTVEYGNENKKGFDIQATSNRNTLIGEAFNVAPSFFQIKKNSVLKKLRKPTLTADFKIIMFNHDAVQPNYTPQPQDNEFFVFVTIGTGEARVVPSPALNAGDR
jgi:hypothetical protein